MTDAFIEEAIAIGERLTSTAIRHREACTWLSRSTGERNSIVPVLRTIDGSVYSGTAGIALFLGRLCLQTDDKVARRTALDAVRYAVRWTRHPSWIDSQPEGRFGYFTGFTGVAWVADELGRTLGEPSLEREVPRLLAALQRPSRAPHLLDLMGGSAGAIPPLLALAQQGRDGAFDAAQAFGQDLLARKQAEPRGGSWYLPPPPGMTFYRNLTGFSHGTSGIGWALSLLYSATNDEGYLEAAQDAFEYERAAFYADVENWPDFRNAPGDDGRHTCQNRWCHGAPGIGVSRVLTYPLLKDDALREEALVARKQTARALQNFIERPAEDHTVCCGILGVTESLDFMDECGSRAPSGDAALAVGRLCLERYGAKARQSLDVDYPTATLGDPHPSLYQGIAGIGHFMLRLHSRKSPPLIHPPRPA